MTTSSRAEGYPFRGQVKFVVVTKSGRLSWFDDYSRAEKAAKRHGTPVELVDSRGYCYQVRPAIIAKTRAGNWRVPPWVDERAVRRWKRRLGAPTSRTLPEIMLHILDALAAGEVRELNEAAEQDVPALLRELLVEVFPKAAR